jgi:hypothetical protein
MSQQPAQSVNTYVYASRIDNDIAYTACHPARYEYGVTPPISRDAPTPQEVTLAIELMKELKAQGTIESEEESRLR